MIDFIKLTWVIYPPVLVFIFLYFFMGLDYFIAASAAIFIAITEGFIVLSLDNEDDY